jgi:hypothetical protein
MDLDRPSTPPSHALRAQRTQGANRRSEAEDATAPVVGTQVLGDLPGRTGTGPSVEVEGKISFRKAALVGHRRYLGHQRPRRLSEGLPGGAVAIELVRKFAFCSGLCYK